MSDPTYVANGGIAAPAAKPPHGSPRPTGRRRICPRRPRGQCQRPGDYRPGQAAAAAAAPRSLWSMLGSPRRHPTLVQTFRAAHLDKPAAACLASRLPYGTPVTLGRSFTVDQAEAALNPRIANCGCDTTVPRLAWSATRRTSTRSWPPGRSNRGGPRGRVHLRCAGLEGFRSGSMNRMLRPPSSKRSPRESSSGEIDLPGIRGSRPVLATLVRRFDVEPDIRRADVEEHRGWIVCLIDGMLSKSTRAGVAPDRRHHGGPAGESSKAEGRQRRLGPSSSSRGPRAIRPGTPCEARRTHSPRGRQTGVAHWRPPCTAPSDRRGVSSA